MGFWRNVYFCWETVCLSVRELYVNNLYLRVCCNKLGWFATCAKSSFYELNKLNVVLVRKRQVGAVKGRSGGGWEGGRWKTAGFRALLRAAASNMESPRSIDKEGCTGLSSVLELGKETWQGQFCCITALKRAVVGMSTSLFKVKKLSILPTDSVFVSCHPPKDGEYVSKYY